MDTHATSNRGLRRPRFAPFAAQRLRGRGVALLAAIALGACAEKVTTECRLGKDCTSGVCSADGTCKAPEADGGLDATPPDADTGDAQATDGGSTDGGVVDTGIVGCGNGDGIVSEGENRSVIGAKATYRVSGTTTFDSAPKLVNGVKTWDFTGALTGDKSIVVESQDPSAGWYASGFVGANFAARLGGESELLGVYGTGTGALRLRGIVSPASGTSSTQLTYDPPVAALSYPLAVGSTFTSTATVSGTAQGVSFTGIFAYKEKWDGTVVDAGTAKTPFGDFPVVRVKMQLTRTSLTGLPPGLLPTGRITYLFVAECYGVVAAVVSKDGETSATFTNVTEVRRLAL